MAAGMDTVGIVEKYCGKYVVDGQNMKNVMHTNEIEQLPGTSKISLHRPYRTAFHTSKKEQEGPLSGRMEGCRFL